MGQSKPGNTPAQPATNESADAGGYNSQANDQVAGGLLFPFPKHGLHPLLVFYLLKGAVTHGNALFIVQLRFT